MKKQKSINSTEEFNSKKMDWFNFSAVAKRSECLVVSVIRIKRKSFLRLSNKTMKPYLDKCFFTTYQMMISPVSISFVQYATCVEQMFSPNR